MSFQNAGIRLQKTKQQPYKVKAPVHDLCSQWFSIDRAAYPSVQRPLCFTGSCSLKTLFSQPANHAKERARSLLIPKV